jgi:hypothetical protein
MWGMIEYNEPGNNLFLGPTPYIEKKPGRVNDRGLQADAFLKGTTFAEDVGGFREARRFLLPPTASGLRLHLAAGAYLAHYTRAGITRC